MRRPGSKVSTSSGRAIPEHEGLDLLDGQEGHALQTGGQLASDGLDFGEFGHREIDRYMLSGALTPRRSRQRKITVLVTRHSARRDEASAGGTPITRQCL